MPCGTRLPACFLLKLEQLKEEFYFNDLEEVRGEKRVEMYEGAGKKWNMGVPVVGRSCQNGLARGQPKLVGHITSCINNWLMRAPGNGASIS